MTYPQYRKARSLVHACCNYDHGNCIALDDGEECVCVQSISCSLDNGAPAKSNDFAGRGGATKRVSFWACTKTNDTKSATTRFRTAVLPLDKGLETALLFRDEMKRCILCGQPFRPGSNRAKYCPACAAQAHRRQKAASERRRRADRAAAPDKGLNRGQLEAKRA